MFKRIFIVITVVLTSLLIGVKSYATESEVKDKSKYSVTGEAQHVIPAGKNKDGDDVYTDHLFSVESDENDVGFYLVRKEYNNTGKYVYNLYGVALDEDRSTVYFKCEDFLDGKPNGMTSGTISKITNGKLFCIHAVEDDELYATDLPIFNEDDVEAIENYKNNGDTSGATNSDSFLDEPDESIPLPHNLKILQGVEQTITGGATGTDANPTHFARDIVISWEQMDVLEGMEYEIEGQFSSARLDDNEIDIKEFTGFYKTIVRDTAYNGSTSMTVTLGKSQLNNLRETGYLTKLVLRVRNTVGNKTSNWVSITIDFKKRTATATEEGYVDSSETGGDEYNDSTVGGENSNVNTSIDVNGFMNYIRNGFGLLGDTGIIALMSKVFLFLPGTFWTIVYCFLACVCVISLAALFIKVVF